MARAVGCVLEEGVQETAGFWTVRRWLNYLCRLGLPPGCNRRLPNLSESSIVQESTQLFIFFCVYVCVCTLTCVCVCMRVCVFACVCV